MLPDDSGGRADTLLFRGLCACCALGDSGPEISVNLVVTKKPVALEDGNDLNSRAPNSVHDAVVTFEKLTEARTGRLGNVAAAFGIVLDAFASRNEPIDKTFSRCRAVRGDILLDLD